MSKLWSRFHNCTKERRCAIDPAWSLAFIDVSGAQLNAPVGGASGCSMGNFRSAAASPAPAATEAARRCVGGFFLGAGHDRVMTSAIRGGVSQHPGIPTALKTQLLRLNWTELNWRLAGSTPVSATMFS